MVFRTLMSALCVAKSRRLVIIYSLGASARQLWFRMLALVSLIALVPDNGDELGTWWLRQRLRVDQDIRPSFDSLMMLISWSV
jgi:hypothetical protein